MSDDKSEGYPRHFATLAGLAPDKVKHFSADDVRVLCDVFKMASSVDPLTADRPLSDIWKDVMRDVTR